MNDLISRQAAIDVIDSYEVDAPDYMQGWAVKLIEAIKGDIRGLISELPSAQPEVKEAVSVIRDFLNRGEFITTSTFKTEDGKILKTDWGYFEDGLNAIERCTGENL